MSDFRGDGPRGRENLSRVAALSGQVVDLTRQIIDLELAEAHRKAAEIEAAKPKPEPLELRLAREFFASEYKDHSEHYRQWAWSEKWPHNTNPAPLAAGWPKEVDPVKFVQDKVGLTALLAASSGKQPEEPTNKPGTFMDAFRTTDAG